MIESEDEDEEEVAEEEGSEEDVDQPRRSIHYVMGDVTHPLDAGTSDRIVVHCAGKLVASACHIQLFTGLSKMQHRILFGPFL